jgi:hypothetical protein
MRVHIHTDHPINLRSINLHEGKVQPPAPEPSVYFRVLHDYEIWVRQFSHSEHSQYYHPVEGWDWREGMPEVFWLFGSHIVPLNRSWQMLFKEMNPTMSPNASTSTWGYGTAFSNGKGKGFDTQYPSSDPRFVPVQNYFENRDIKPGVPMLSKDKVRTCGGASIRGYIDGDMLVVETLNGNEDAPDWSWLKQRPWLYFEAVSAEKNKVTKQPQIVPFPQGGGKPVLIPLVARFPVRTPLGSLQKMDKIADPYKIYIS